MLRNNNSEACLSEEFEIKQKECFKTFSDIIEEKSDKGYLINEASLSQQQIPENFYGEDYSDDYTDTCIYGDECYDEDGYIEYPNYGDGVDEETFSNIKISFFKMISATYISGKRSEEAVNFLSSIIGICNLEQREELMKLKKNGHFPLSLISKFGDLGMVRFFIQYCNADVTGIVGRLALIWAVNKQHLEILDYLLECGGDIGTNIYKNTLLTVSLGINFSEASQKDPCFNFDFGRQYHMISMDTFKFLIKKGVVEKSSSESLFRCLTHCIDCIHIGLFRNQSKYSECIKLLLDKIDNIDNLRDENGCSVLGYAITYRKTEMIEQLLEAGANINHVNLLNYISWYDLKINETETLDSILDKLFTNLTNKTKETIINDRKSYVHPIKYVASHGFTKILKCLLRLPEIDLCDKIDAVEVYGANLVLRSKSEDALKCWNACMNLRMGCYQPSVSSITKESKDKTLSSDIGYLCTDEGFRAENLAENTNDDEESVDEQSNISGISSIDHEMDYVGIADEHSFIDIFIDKAASTQEIIENLNECYRTSECQAYPKRIVNVSRPVFNYVLECQSKQDLQNLEQDDLGLLTQSALIYERVMGYLDSTVVVYFERLAQHYQKQGNLVQYLSVLVYSLVHLCTCTRVKKIDNTSCIMSDMLLKLIFDVLSKKKKCIFRVGSIITVTKMVFIHLSMVITTFRRNSKKIYRINHMSGLLSLLELINNTEKTLEEYVDFKRLFKTILHFDHRDEYGQSLLHYASLVRNDTGRDRALEMNFINPFNWNITMFNGGSLSLTRLLLSNGADPSVQDHEGRTSLHAIYMNVDIEVCPEVSAIVNDLINAGGHLDTPDCQSKTPIDYSETTKAPLCPLRHRNLQCLSSAVILEHEIQYQNDLPLHLINFIELHKVNGEKENCRFFQDKYKRMLLK